MNFYKNIFKKGLFFLPIVIYSLSFASAHQGSVSEQNTVAQSNLYKSNIQNTDKENTISSLSRTKKIIIASATAVVATGIAIVAASYVLPDAAADAVTSIAETITAKCKEIITDYATTTFKSALFITSTAITIKSIAHGIDDLDRIIKSPTIKINLLRRINRGYLIKNEKLETAYLAKCEKYLASRQQIRVLHEENANLQAENIRLEKGKIKIPTR